MSAPRTWPAIAVDALPEVDETITALPWPARRRLAEAWIGRARGELGASAIFSHLVGGLLQRGSDPELVWLASKAVSDELRHTEICRHLASAYAGEPVAWPECPPVSAPAYGRASPRFTTTLHVVHSCCLSETIGAAYLQGCLAPATGALVRAGLRALLRDEINHARIGWGYLGDPRFDAEERRELARALPLLLEHVRTRWRTRPPGWTDPVEGHGCMMRARTREVVDEAIVTLVLPGLDHVGVDTADARRYLQRLGVRVDEPAEPGAS